LKVSFENLPLSWLVFGLDGLTNTTCSHRPSNSTTLRTPKVTIYNEVPKVTLRQVQKVTAYNEVPSNTGLEMSLLHTTSDELPANFHNHAC
jgi:hypothetical protein